MPNQSTFPNASWKLDALRSYAVLLVLFSHASKALGILDSPFRFVQPVGDLGVLLFFIHTSLVLMFSLERQQARGARRLFAPFMVRRVFRIYPVCVIVVLVLFAFRIPAHEIATHDVTRLDTDAVGLATNVLLIQNVIVSTDLGGSILAALWSLPYEVQMYAVLPAIFLAIRRWRSLPLLVTAWGALAVIGLLSRGLLSHFGATIATFDRIALIVPDFLYYVPCFLAGVLAYRLWLEPGRRLPFATLPVLLVAVTGAFAVSRELPHAYALSSIAGIAICVVVGALLPFIREPHHRLLGRSAEHIARYSYGIYLVHIPCIWLAFDVLAETPLVIQLAVFALSVTAIPILSFHLIESPMIRVGARVSRAVDTPRVASVAVSEPTH